MIINDSIYRDNIRIPYPKVWNCMGRLFGFGNGYVCIMYLSVVCMPGRVQLQYVYILNAIQTETLTYTEWKPSQKIQILMAASWHSSSADLFKGKGGGGAVRLQKAKKKYSCSLLSDRPYFFFYTWPSIFYCKIKNFQPARAKLAIIQLIKKCMG
jgi:hypothetical protein